MTSLVQNTVTLLHISHILSFFYIYHTYYPISSRHILGTKLNVSRKDGRKHLHDKESIHLIRRYITTTTHGL